MSSVVSVLGGDTPLGREVKEQIEVLNSGVIVRTFSVGRGAQAGRGEEDDEEESSAPLDAETLRTSLAVVLAADAVGARNARQLAGGDSGPAFVDLTYGLEGLPEARLTSDLAGVSQPVGTTNLYVVAHPAASTIALILLRLHARYPVRQAVAQILEPASERGQAGLTELQKQVTSLLSFKPLEKKIFDAQIAFNLLGRFGEDAPEKLQDIEGRVERHLTSLLGGKAPLPSIRLIQAPVFHGHTISLWLEFAERPEVEDIEAELESAGIDIRTADLEPPSNVGTAGQAGVTAGLIEADRNHPRSAWILAVADNYRVAADNAAAVIRDIIGRRSA